MPLTDIVTPQWLKDRFLVGINLTDDDDNPYPDEHFLHAIDMAIAHAEAKYDIILRQSRKFSQKERVDTNWFDSDTYYLTLTEKRPVQSIQRFAVQFGNYPASNIPTSWVHVVSKKAGQIQIIPGPEGFSLPFISGSTPLLGFDALSGRGYVPQWIAIDYKAGFEYDLSGTVTGANGQRALTFTSATTPASDGDNQMQGIRTGTHVLLAPGTGQEELHRVARVTDTGLVTSVDLAHNHVGVTVVVLDYDPAILEAIGLVASLPILDTAGDLIIGAGISNQSISIDGLSQSIGTTSGVENSGFGARSIQYNKRLELLDKHLRRTYRRHSFFAI